MTLNAGQDDVLSISSVCLLVAPGGNLLGGLKTEIAKEYASGAS